MRDLMHLGLSRSTLAVAQLGFVSGLFVPGFSRNPCLEGELDLWVPFSPVAPPCPLVFMVSSHMGFSAPELNPGGSWQGVP